MQEEAVAAAEVVVEVAAEVVVEVLLVAEDLLLE